MNLAFLLTVATLWILPEMGFGAVGCRIKSGSTIYTTSSTYLLGVDIGAGLSLSLGGRLYHPSPTINSNTSCTIPWAKNVTLSTLNGCIYGSPTINIPGVSAVCLTCQYGDVVDYTSTLECPLDDYSWAFGASAAALGIFVIRKRKK